MGNKKWIKAADYEHVRRYCKNEIILSYQVLFSKIKLYKKQISRSSVK